MSDEPTRLRLDPETDSELRATLEAARGDHRDDDRIERLALRLGPLFLPPNGGGGGGGGAGGPAVKAASVAKTATTFATVAKGIALVAVLGAAGTVVVIERREPASIDPAQAATTSQSPSPHEDTPSVTPTGPAEPPSEPTSDSVEEPVIEGDEPTDPRPHPRRDRVIAPEVETLVPPETNPAPPPEPQVTSVEAVPPEPFLIRTAMVSLGRDPAAALAQADLHARHYPSGAMSDEREVIAIDALVRLGRRAEAEARATRFRGARPSSPSIRRIERILAN